MEKERTDVAERDGQPMFDGYRLFPAAGLEDQVDMPHTAGAMVVRRDEHGWYMRTGACEGGNAFAEGGCSGHGREMVEDYLEDGVSYPVCVPCWQATSDER